MVMVEDVFGNSNSCSFEVEVLEYVLFNLIVVCNDFLYLILGLDCMVEVIVDMILEGGDYCCYDSYDIIIFVSIDLDVLVILMSFILGMD